MPSRSIKRSRKELDSEIPAEEITVKPAVKSSPGRSRKLESEKKKYVPTGRPRGRPRNDQLDPEKKKGKRGRPRSNPIDDSIDKEGKDETVNSKSAKKVISSGNNKRGTPKKQ